MSRRAAHVSHGSLSMLPDADDADDGPAERFLPLVEQSALSAGGGGGAIGAMSRAFQLLGPDDEQTINADNIVTLFRRLGYKPDPAAVAARFAALTRRCAEEDAAGSGGGGGGPGAGGRSTPPGASNRASGIGAAGGRAAAQARRAAATAASVGLSAAPGELHLNSFIGVLRAAESARSARSFYAGSAAESTAAGSGDLADASYSAPLDSELDDLLRSFDLMALASASADSSAAHLQRDELGSLSSSSAPADVAPYLLDLRTLRQRLRVSTAASKLSESELQQLIDVAGVVDAQGKPAPNALQPQHAYINYRKLVHKLAENKIELG